MRAASRKQDSQPAVDKRAIAFVSALPGEGKTTIASAAAYALRARRVAVGVMVPVALGCRRERTRFVSPDAELLAHYANAPESLEVITPCARADNRPPYTKTDPRSTGADVDEILRQFETIRRRVRIVLIEVHGGLLFPIARGIDQASLLERMGAEIVVVASASADAFAQVLMTIECAKSRDLDVVGVALNRYDPDGATLADETNPEWIQRHGRVELPTMVPVGKNHSVDPPRLDRNLIATVKPLALSWLGNTRG